MIIFKCKMCGGDLGADQSMAIGTCQRCGSTITRPEVLIRQALTVSMGQTNK